MNLSKNSPIIPMTSTLLSDFICSHPATFCNPAREELKMWTCPIIMCAAILALSPSSRSAGSYGYKVGEHFEFRAKNIYKYIKNLRLIKFLARDD